MSWKVYNDSVPMSLTRAQFITQLGNPFLEGHFHSFGQFRKDALAGTLPAYSFVEPSFLVRPNDQLPPHDVRAGERFLYDVWTAVSRGKHWNETLLVITYDEHGGCFDHVKPPDTAKGLNLAPAKFAVAEETPLNSIQKAILAASVTQHRGAEPDDLSIRREVERVKTHGDAQRFLQELL